MPNVNFYLKSPDKAGNRLIYLQMKYSGMRFVFSTGETVTDDQWNFKKQKVKNTKATTADGKHNLNDLLSNLESECLRAYNAEIKNGRPSPATLKKFLTDFMNKNNDKEEAKIGLFSFLDSFIEKSRGELAENTVKKYETLRTHLKEFHRKKEKIDFDSINLNFFDNYIIFLKSKKLSRNTIAKDIALIKTLMNEAVDRDLTDNIKFKHRKFTYAYEDVESIYLNEKEIQNFYKYDLSQNPRLQKVRDLFVFGCWVGLRYSDYSSVKPENIIDIDGEPFIKMITKKTRETVIIPCHPLVLEIFNKYPENSNRLPKAPAIQKFNEWIKEAAKVAQLNESGRLLSEPDKKLYECISSHTARRSFATNLYLSGFPTLEIMKITGHKTEKAFMKYIKVSKLDAAKKLSAHMKMMWNQKLLKVV